jgi:kynurenine formamidase
LTVNFERPKQENTLSIQQIDQYLVNKVVLSLCKPGKEKVLIEQTIKNTNTKQPIRWLKIFNSNFESANGDSKKNEFSNWHESHQNSLCLLNVIDISEDIDIYLQRKKARKDGVGSS